MPTLLDHIFGFFQNYLANAQDTDNAEEPKVIRFWPRKLNYTSSSDMCDKEEGQNECDDEMTCCDEGDDNEEECEIQESGGGEEGETDECPCEPSRFARRMKLVSRAAKYGMKEGALCGIFFGGGWGIYKWIDNNYLSKGSGEDESGGGGADDDSTTNTNLIFVTAVNSAMAMGVICTFLCCTKAIIYCN